jgi:O-antigen/teichoic acid export membrane protein
LTASGASWIPAIVYTIGVHLGPVLVFGSQGAGEAGVYYMAFAILLAMAAITQVLFSIGYPMLSAMQDGRKRFIWQATKMTLIISLPLSSAIIFYAQDVMALFGDAYMVASLSLAVLLSSVLPITLSNCITTLTYAYGNYRQVLAIGLASNVPRALLYLFLLPIYGNLGAAIAYSIGSLVGLVISVIIAEKLKMKILWRQLILLMIIPSGIALSLSYLGINYILGIVTSLIISYVLFIRLRLLTGTDFQYLVEFLPNGLSKKIIAMLDSIDKLRGSN